MAERLTAMDVERQDFKRKLRGYDEDDVRLYLKSVAEEISRLNLETATQREELAALRIRTQEFGARERSLQDALAAAQRLSDEMLDRARVEGERLVKEARVKAERLLEQSQDQLVRLQDEIGRSRLERDTFERQLRSLVEQHLELLDLRSRDHRGRNTTVREALVREAPVREAPVHEVAVHEAGMHEALPEVSERDVEAAFAEPLRIVRELEIEATDAAG